MVLILLMTRELNAKLVQHALFLSELGKLESLD